MYWWRRSESRSRRALTETVSRPDEASASSPAVIHLERILKALDKAVPVEWFRQVADRSGRKRLRAGLLIGECGEKDKRDAATLCTQMILQLDAAHAGHLDVSNNTREVVKPARLQECFGRYECMHDISERPHEAVGRGAHGCIVINDCDKRRL
jgi:hypothetical protein